MAPSNTTGGTESHPQHVQSRNISKEVPGQIAQAQPIGVPIMHTADLSYEQFVADYMQPNLPVMIQVRLPSPCTNINSQACLRSPLCSHCQHNLRFVDHTCTQIPLASAPLPFTTPPPPPPPPRVFPPPPPPPSFGGYELPLAFCFYPGSIVLIFSSLHCCSSPHPFVCNPSNAIPTSTPSPHDPLGSTTPFCPVPRPYLLPQILLVMFLAACNARSPNMLRRLTHILHVRKLLCVGPDRQMAVCQGLGNIRW